MLVFRGVIDLENVNENVKQFWMAGLFFQRLLPKTHEPRLATPITFALRTRPLISEVKIMLY